MRCAAMNGNVLHARAAACVAAEVKMPRCSYVTTVIEVNTRFGAVVLVVNPFSGWHMSCFDPPYREPPEGRWHCPSCPPVDYDPQEELPMQSPEVQEILSQLSSIQQSSIAIRESSVASSSQYAPPFSDVPDLQDHVLTTDASEVEFDPADPVDPALRRSTRKRQRSRKGKEVDMNAAEDEQEQFSVNPAPAIRRLRIRVSSPPPPPAENETPPTIRLRVPARGKGKAREDPPSEDIERGLFDDILSPEDRDTRETTIGLHDHERFERSRANAEVSPAVVDFALVLADSVCRFGCYLVSPQNLQRLRSRVLLLVHYGRMFPSLLVYRAHPCHLPLPLPPVLTPCTPMAYEYAEFASASTISTPGTMPLSRKSMLLFRMVASGCVSSASST